MRITPAHADLYVANSVADTVYASRTASDCGFSTGDIAVGDRPIGLAVHPDGSKLYVTNSNAGTVSVIDTATRSLIATISVGGSPTHVAVHPNGTRAYVTTSNRVEVVDTASHTVVTRMFVIGIANGVAVSPAGTHLYVVTQAGYVHVIDPASNSALTQFPVGTSTLKVAFHPNGDRAYVATTDGISRGWITVIDVLGGTVLTTVPVEGTPINITPHPNGQRLYVVNDLSPPEVPARGQLAVIDTTSNAVTQTTLTGRSPYGLAVDSRHVYVSNQVDASVSVFDRETLAEIDVMEVGSIPTGVATYVPPLPPPLPSNIQVTGIEVTQGIQDLDNSVTLVAERRTFARVYLRSDPGTTVRNVTGALFGVPDDCTLAGCSGVTRGPVRPAGGSTIINVVDAPSRANFGQSLLFELPFEWTEQRPLRLHFVPGLAGATPTACRLDAPTTRVAFDTPAWPRVQLIRAAYDNPAGAGMPAITTTEDDQDLSESWIRRALPVSSFDPGRDWSFYDAGLLARVNRTHEECQALNPPGNTDPEKDERSLCAQRYLSTHPALLDASAGMDGAYVLIRQDPAVPFTRGACCNNARLGVGPSWPGAPQETGNYTAHELAHLFGRDHPAENSIVCRHSASDPFYPYAFAMIHPFFPYDPERGLAGFDAGDAALTPTIGRAYRAGYTAHDVMSYCDPATQWISDYTYEGIYNAIRSPQPPVFGLGGGGGPQLGDWLMVLGDIKPSLPTAPLIRARRVDRVSAIPTRTAGDHAIRLTNASGVTLAEYSFAPEVVADAADAASAARAFAHVVPFAVGTRAIQIVDYSAGGRVVGTRSITPTAPVISDVEFEAAPSPGASEVTIRWAANDADGDALSYDVFVTHDDGNTVRPLMLGLSGNSARIDATELGGGAVRFRVVASDGVQSAFRDTPSFVLATKPPRPRIVTPGNAISITAGQLVNFEGEAMDAQDGRVPAANLSWEVPGRAPRSGARVSVDDLSIGVHDVVLTATNSAGLSASTTARVIVGPESSTPATQLTVGPQQLGWHLAPGDTTPQTANLYLASLGNGSLGFTASTNVPWLSVDPPNGSTVPAATTVTANPAGLAAGTTARGVVTLSATGGLPQTITIPVTLSVGETWGKGVDVTPPTETCASDVSTQIVVSRTGLRLNRTTRRYVQTVTLRNASAATLAGPISLALSGLGANVTLANKTADTVCTSPADPYIDLGAGPANALGAGESASVVLEFSNPSQVPLSYATRVLAGPNRR